MPDISKIRLPGSNTDYDIKDAVARQMISGGVSFIIAWDGTAVPTVAEIPEGVVVKYNGTNYTGTLPADDATAGAFYLIKSATAPSSETLDIYDEYVPAGTTGSKFWEKIGDTQLNLTDVVTGVSLSKQTDVVLGEATTFTNSSSAVTLGTPTKDNVLGEATTFSGSASGGDVALNSTYLSAEGNGTASVVTGYTPTTDTFLKSASAETSKLVTTSITPTNGTESVSKVTKTASKLVTTSIPNVTGNTSVSIPNVTGNTSVTASKISSNSSVTANKSTWSFSMGTGTAAETLIIGGGNGSDVTATNTAYSDVTASNTTLGTALSASKVTLGTAITAATGAVASTGTGSDIVTGVDISDKTVAKAGSAVTVATGSVASTGTGSDIVTGVTVGTTASAVTGLGTPATSTVLTGVKLQSNTGTATGRVQVVTGKGTVTQPTITVTAGTNDKVSAVTVLPSSGNTAAAQTITVGTNDKVTALKSTTDVSVTKGNQ